MEYTASRRPSRRLLILSVAAALVLLPWLDATGRTLAFNSLWLLAGTLALALPLGVGLALILTRTDLPGRKFWWTLLLLQLFVPLYVHAAAWDAGFGLDGWFTKLLKRSVPAAELVVPLAKWRGALWVHVVSTLPWIVAIVGTSLSMVERELEEAALLCGSPRQVVWRITLPRAAPGVAVAALWVFVLTMSEMTATNVFQVRTFAEEEVYSALANWATPGQALRVVWPMLGVVVLCVVAAAEVCLWLGPRVRRATGSPPLVFQLGRWRPSVSLAATALLSFLLLVPLASLVYQAGMTFDKSTGQGVRTWSPATVPVAVSRGIWEGRREFRWSLQIAAASATAAVAVGLPLAWLARQGRRRGLAVLSGTAALWAIPAPLLSLFIIVVLNRPGWWTVWLYDRTEFAPCLALVVRGLPLATLVLWAAFRSLPAETLEAAAVQGAGPFARFLYIALPQRWPALICAWCVVFVVGVGDLSATILLLRPGVETIAVKIFRMIHASTNEQTAGMCLALLAIVAAGMAAAALARRLMRKHSPTRP
ncbi:MAG: iron ABC transporter permease [Planctomycetia bacterium]|nr:iron ABC transporter permease [Planctomycetia bacterium]